MARWLGDAADSLLSELSLQRLSYVLPSLTTNNRKNADERHIENIHFDKYYRFFDGILCYIKCNEVYQIPRYVFCHNDSLHFFRLTTNKAGAEQQERTAEMQLFFYQTYKSWPENVQSSESFPAHSYNHSEELCMPVGCYIFCALPIYTQTCSDVAIQLVAFFFSHNTTTPYNDLLLWK